MEVSPVWVLFQIHFHLFTVHILFNTFHLDIHIISHSNLTVTPW